MAAGQFFYRLSSKRRCRKDTARKFLMKTLQIVIPMAGRGSRFAKAGYQTPKPLIPVGGRPMIQWVIENIRPQRAHRFIFICLAEHLELYPEVPAELRRLWPGWGSIPVSREGGGGACAG